MLLRLLVVVDAHEENVAGVFGYLRGIFLALDLVDGSVGGMIEFQFNDECRLADVAAGNHHKVGIALTRGIFAMDDVLIARPNIGDGQDTGEGVLIIIGEDAGVLVMGLVDAFCHGLFVAGDSGGEKVLGSSECIDKPFP